MNKQIWRDNIVRDESDLPTINTVVITAIDIVGKMGIFTGYIKHVIAFHGKGFMSSVETSGSVETSDVFRGTDNNAYAKCLKVCQRTLKKHYEDLEQEFKAQMRLQKGRR